MPAPDPLDIFLGNSTPLRASVYARLPAREPYLEGQLAGVITGPRCATSRMLPADYPLRDRGPGPTRLAQAVVPDPCYWSADLPALYDVRVEWRVGDDVRQVWTRTIGLRRFGVHGRNWNYEGKRWVLRGVWRESTDETSWDAWHEESAVCVCPALTDEAGAHASRVGVPLLVGVSAGLSAIEPELRRLSRIPAVLGVLIGRNAAAGSSAESLRQAAGGLMLIESYDDTDAPAAWADALLAPAELLVSHGERLRAWSGPIVASRRLASPRPLSIARNECDLLQSDLAPHGDFAGYVV